MVLVSVLVLTTVMGLRLAYSVQVQNWPLWVATVLASWACVFSIGYTVSVVHHDWMRERVLNEMNDDES